MQQIFPWAGPRFGRSFIEVCNSAQTGVHVVGKKRPRPRYLHIERRCAGPAGKLMARCLSVSVRLFLALLTVIVCGNRENLVDFALVAAPQRARTTRHCLFAMEDTPNVSSSVQHRRGPSRLCSWVRHGSCDGLHLNLVSWRMA